MSPRLAIHRIALLLTVALMLGVYADGQKPKFDTEQRYLLLATKKTGTMQKELNEAAAQGYRVVVGSPTSGSEMAILLERVATPPDTYQYKLLATTRTGTMDKELNEVAVQGYRLLPRTMISKVDVSLFSGGQEIVVLLEKAPNSKKFYHYKLLATTLTSTLQKEITQSLAEGYTLAGMVSRGEHMVIMEKESPGE
jgi:hypothetical protein